MMPDKVVSPVKRPANRMSLHRPADIYQSERIFKELLPVQKLGEIPRFSKVWLDHEPGRFDHCKVEIHVDPSASRFVEFASFFPSLLPEYEGYQDIMFWLSCECAGMRRWVKTDDR